MRLRNLTPLFCAASVALCMAAARAQTGYTLTELGTINGAYNIQPKDIDDAGGVVRVTGTTSDRNGNGYHGFYWDSATHVMVDIGVALAGTNSSPKDVNRYGEVVGKSNTTPTGGNGRAIYWNPSRGANNPLLLPFPAGFDPNTTSNGASAINDAGIIVGNLYRSDTGGIPVYWKRDASGAFVCTILSEIPGSQWTNDRGATDINERGDICGFVGSPAAYNHTRGVVWVNQGASAADPVYGEPSQAGLPDYATWPYMSGEFITESGLVGGGHEDASGAFHRHIWNPFDTNALLDTYDAGGVTSLGESGASTGWTYQFDGGKRRAYLHRYGATTINLGVLTGVSTYTSTSSHVNAFETVVGSSEANRKGEVHAFRWTAAGGMFDLNNLTPSKGTLTYLSGAAKITDSGKILGSGPIKSGYQRAFVLTPNP